MRRILKNTYWFLVALPDIFYPFASKVDGEWVRGRRSYERAAKRAFRKYGLGRIGYKLGLYREVFHLIGSILFIIFATLVSKELFGSDAALYVLLGAAIVALAFQEFYVHPKHFGQHARKGITDYLVWVVPMLVYIFR